MQRPELLPPTPAHSSVADQILATIRPPSIPCSARPPMPPGISIPPGLPPFDGFGVPSEPVETSIRQTVELQGEIIGIATTVGSLEASVEASSLETESAIPVAHENVLAQLKRRLESAHQLVGLYREAAALRKQARPFIKSDPVETWAYRWFASPIAYLFPEIRREEWLGDLYETNREMLLKNYPRWSVNMNNVVRAIALIESGLRQKIQAWLSLWKQMK